MDKDPEDPFSKSFATLQKIVGSPERAPTTEASSQLTDELKSEQANRQAVLQKIQDALKERNDLEQAAATTKEEWKAECQQEEQWKEALQAEQSRHDKAVTEKRTECQKILKEAESITQIAMGAAEAKAASLELHCQELEQQLPQRDVSLQEARQAHQKEEAAMQHNVKTLLEDLKEAQANLKILLAQHEKTATVVDEESTAAEPPPSKKLKVVGMNDWIGHALNIHEALVDAYKEKSLSEMVDAPLSIFKDFATEAVAALQSLHIHTVRDLGGTCSKKTLFTILVWKPSSVNISLTIFSTGYKFFKISKAIKTLAETEGRRLPGTRMNLDNCLDKEHEQKSLKEILLSPVSALQGLSTKADKALGLLGVTTIGEFATFNYALLAEAITELAPFEETKTKAEKRKERMIHQLE